MINNAQRISGIDASILRVIASSHRAIGQGAINLVLRKQGISTSSPTVGRKLQTLEADGFVRKVSVEGRVITSRGRVILHRYDGDARLSVSGDALLNALRRGDRRHLLDLLAARRALEGEAAALAAVHASPRALRRMETLLEQQSASLTRDDLGLAQDIDFHREIARASQNEVLLSLVSLLRNHRRYDLSLTSIRTAVGSRLVIDHRAILSAIAARDPNAARAAMERHLDKLVDDLNRYWTRRHGRRHTTGEPPMATNAEAIAAALWKRGESHDAGDSRRSDDIR